MPSTAAQLDHCSEMYDRYRLCYVVLWYWVLAAVLVRLLGGVDAIVARRAENRRPGAAATRLQGVRASRPFVSAESFAAPPRLRETFEDPPRRPAPREFGRGATRPAAAERAGRHAAAPRRVVARDRRALREVPSGVDRAAAAAWV